MLAHTNGRRTLAEQPDVLFSKDDCDHRRSQSHEKILKLSLSVIKAGEAADHILGFVVLSGGKIVLKEDDDGIYRYREKVTTERERTIIAVSVVCALLGTAIVVFGAYRWRRKSMLFAYNHECSNFRWR